MRGKLLINLAMRLFVHVMTVLRHVSWMGEEEKGEGGGKRGGCRVKPHTVQKYKHGTNKKGSKDILVRHTHTLHSLSLYLSHTHTYRHTHTHTNTNTPSFPRCRPAPMMS